MYTYELESALVVEAAVWSTMHLSIIIFIVRCESSYSLALRMP